MDNHSINNVVFNVLAPDGVTPLPAGVWPKVAQVRAAVFEAIAELAPPGLSFIFTNYIRGDDPAEEAAYRCNLELAAARGATYVPVLLRCRTDELLRRIVSDDRRARLKMIDPVAGRRLNDDVPLLAVEHPNLLRLDVTALTPEAAAARIAAWAGRCRPA